MKRTLLLLAAFALVCTTTVSVSADTGFGVRVSDDTKYNFYGIYKMNFFYIDSESPGPLNTSIIGGENQDRDNDQDVQLRGISTSRIGGVFTNEKLKGNFEVGFKRDDDPNDALELQMRRLSAEWDFGKGALLVGHDYTPLFFSYGAQAFGDFGAQGVGNHYVGRRNQLGVNLKNGLKMSLIEIHNEDNLGLETADLDVTFPKFEIGYGKRYKTFSYNLGGGYMQYKLEDDATDFDETISAWMVAGAVKFRFGKSGLWLGANYSQNQELYGATNLYQHAKPVIEAGGDLKNCTTIGWHAVVYHMFSRKWMTFMGYGEQTNDWEDNPTNREEEETISTWYWNVIYKPHSRVYIAPEIGFIELSDDGWLFEAGPTVADFSGYKGEYAGVFFRVDF